MYNYQACQTCQQLVQDSLNSQSTSKLKDSTRLDKIARVFGQIWQMCEQPLLTLNTTKLISGNCFSHKNRLLGLETIFAAAFLKETFYIFLVEGIFPEVRKLKLPHVKQKRVSIFLVQYLENRQKIIVRFFDGRSTMYLSNI